MKQGIDMRELHTEVLALQVVVSALANRHCQDNNFIAVAMEKLAGFQELTLDHAQRDELKESVKHLIYG